MESSRLRTPRTRSLVEEAVARARSGDREAMHFLYARFRAGARRRVASVVHSLDRAEEIVDGIFANLDLRDYEEADVGFERWLLRRSAAVALANVQGPDSQRLREAVASLSDEQREILVLRDVLGLSPGQIAEALGDSEQSVRRQHRLGRLAVQESLA